MKTRQIATLKIVVCLGTVWKHLSPIPVFVILSLALQPHQSWAAPGRSFPSMPYLPSAPSSSTSSSSASSTSTLSTFHNSDEVEDFPSQPDALARLSKVFGISRIPVKHFHRSPPQYMQDLYASITDAGGLSRASGPYNSNIIRSFPDKDSIHRMHFHYNISYLEEEENILEAEFHLFKMRPKPSTAYEPKPPHVILIKIYQVLDVRDMTSQRNLLLLDAQRISAHGHGWFVFNVTKAVLSWHYGTTNNFGFLVTTETTTGVHVNGSYIRFAQRNEHHESKQPILVVFNEDGRQKHPTYISPEDEEYMEIKEDILMREYQKQHRQSEDFQTVLQMLNERGRSNHRSSRSSRSKRSTKNRGGGRKKRTFDMYRYRHNRRSCTRYEMFVDFEEIGWSGWIISPNSYNAYHCAGDCPFPLGQSQKPTNHATVQSIVHALGVGKNVGTPCCVPNKLYSISLLYFDDNENVILKQYDDMVVASCGCH